MFPRTERERCPSPARRWLALGAVGALLLGSFGCHDNEPKAGGANTQKAKESRKVAENSAIEAVQTAAKEQVAHHRELKEQSKLGNVLSTMRESFALAANASPPAPPKAPALAQPQTIVVNNRTESPMRRVARDVSPVVISERIVTDIPYPTEAEADARTLEEAQKVIEKRLRELDPPVEYQPPISVVKNEYVRKESRLVRSPSEKEKSLINAAVFASDWKYVEYTVEITGEQVRELRTRNRVSDGLRALGAIAAVSLAGFCFLRLDEWSKGYLTSWLALAAAALGGGIVALVVTA